MATPLQAAQNILASPPPTEDTTPDDMAVIAVVKTLHTLTRDNSTHEFEALNKPPYTGADLKLYNMYCGQTCPDLQFSPKFMDHRVVTFVQDVDLAARRRAAITCRQKDVIMVIIYRSGPECPYPTRWKFKFPLTVTALKLKTTCLRHLRLGSNAYVMFKLHGNGLSGNLYNNSNIATVYQRYCANDGILYIGLGVENTFG